MTLNESCWIWTRGRFPNGYGQAWKHAQRTKPTGRYGRPIQAHRLVYEMYCGPVPGGMHLDHICRQRGCVNPAHLRVVTCRENVHAEQSKCLAAANTAKTHCKRGHILEAENLYVYRGSRHCKACRRDEKRVRRQRVALAA